MQAIVYIGCEKSKLGIISKEPQLMEIPVGFPSMSIPEDNTFTTERWQLGKKLFYDKKLSLNNTISCGSCHRQEFAFSDSLAFSPGDLGAMGVSNVPALANIGYHPYYLRGGSVPTLEMQVLVPVQEHNEFNMEILDLAERLKQDSTYSVMALKAYKRELDPFVITRAIACFERSLISGNSRFDQYYYQNKKNALTANELNGMNLFFSEKTNCSGCHRDFNFTNYSFENNGLYLQYADSGRMRFTHVESDRDKFKVPTLRNIALTAPYMHDGSLKNLEAVIEHYNSGGVNHPNKSVLLKPLHLSAQEKQDLIAFLKTLSDDNFIRDKRFKNE
ncbi:c-type cytochrome [Taibaiella lutea]|uniref:C-type cytochrome n=2 Tax=Taibaiella lutea TaxID=2608001 RepID=A0A5M6CRB2_9BACT|nr:c-type cytochrome [Taibaiella lutea]